MEEEEAELGGDAAPNGVNGTQRGSNAVSVGAGAGAKRRGRKKIEVDGEKVDGRAGPRSENVVLSKSE